MTFLTPIPAILAAAIALPVLALLYFLKLRRRPVRISSTMFWEQATRDLQVNVPFRMIRASWLLLLQLLILTLLLLAMARPSIQTEAGPAARTMILIDRSASMSAKDGQGDSVTRLDEAKRRAIEIVDSLGKGGTGRRGMVVVFADRAVALTNFTENKRTLRDAIERIEPTDQSADLSAALELVEAMAAGEISEDVQPEPATVILLSDGSFTDTGYALAGAELRFEAVGSPTESPSDNIGIVAMAARRDYKDPAIVRIFVRLISTAQEDVTVPVLLSVDGEVVQRKALTVPGRGNQSDLNGQDAGAAVTFELAQTQGGVIVVLLDRDDLLEADNAAAIVLAPASRPAVLLVRPDEHGPTDWILDSVLDEMPLRLVREIVESEYRQWSIEDRLGGFDLVIFDRVRAEPPPPCPSLSFGGTIESAAVSFDETAELQSTRVLTWERTHPILRDVSLDPVLVAQPMSMSTTDSPGAEILVRGRHGPLMILLDDRGRRRLLVGFDLAQTNWPTNFGFAIFMVNALDYLTVSGRAQVGRSYTTDQPAFVRTVPGAGRVQLTGPDGRTFQITPHSLDDEQASAGVLVRAGVYLATNAAEPAIAINMLDEHESRIQRQPMLRIGGVQVASMAGAGKAPRELWPLFVMGACILLGIEWLLFGALMRI